jgi:uncharacterized membrane protein YgaE (UPF0421/DUF939 family)
LRLSFRAATAAGITVAIAQAAGLLFPVYAMIAAVIVTDLDPAKTREQAIPRVIGTVGAGVIGALAAQWLPPEGWAIALAILVPMFAFRAVGMSDAAKLAGYVTALIVLQHTGHPWMYATDRVIETLLGVCVAVLVSFVPQLAREDEPRAPAA